MVKKYSISPLILFLFLAFTMTGCGGGGGGDSSTASPPVSSPTLQVLPASFDFGAVTPGNSAAPLEVRIKNTGTAALQVSNIALSDPTHFSLNTNGGSKPCASGSPTIPAADSCTFQVGFDPGAIDGIYAGNVQIRSNDGSSPVFTLALNGSFEPVRALTLRINQLQTKDPCPTFVFNAYVSVTDQGGFPLTDLMAADFSVTEGGGDLGNPTTADYVGNINAAVSIAAVMDYSGSQTDQPQAVADMENGFIYLFNNLKATDSDQGEIIKFDTEFEVVQPFTSDKAALTAAISAAFDKGLETRLYDAVYKAVDDTGLKTDFRRAVIVATDGADSDVNGGPISTYTLQQVIDNANTKGVPIFTIGIGALLDRNVLERMANETGGQFFEAPTSQNLATIFQQLTSVLYENQYILTFQSQLGGGGKTADLNIKATTPPSIPPGGQFGDDTVLITSCN
jgi:Ca-activated chloride channel homolog